MFGVFTCGGKFLSHFRVKGTSVCILLSYLLLSSYFIIFIFHSCKNRTGFSRYFNVLDILHAKMRIRISLYPINLILYFIRTDFFSTWRFFINNYCFSIEKNDADQSSRQAQVLWSACQSLLSAIRSGCPGLPWKEQLRPLEPELNAVKSAAGKNRLHILVVDYIQGISIFGR